MTLVEQLQRLADVDPLSTVFQIRGAASVIEVQRRDSRGAELRLVTSMPDEAEFRTTGYRDAGRAIVNAQGPIALYLRTETSADRLRPAGQPRSELQTGDIEFDAAVYVETQTDHTVAKELLLSNAARSAILDLLREGPASVVLDDWTGSVVVTVHSPTDARTDDERGRRIVLAIDALRSALPPIRRRSAAGFRGLIGGGARSVPAAPGTRSSASVTAMGLVFSFVGSTLASGFASACVASFVFVFFAPDTCLSAVPDEPGTNYFICAAPECCEPLLTGLWWGLQGVLVLWGLLLVAGIAGFRREAHRGAAWMALAAGLGTVAPIALGIGVIAARVASRWE